jgi:hypothetical protein
MVERYSTPYTGLLTFMASYFAMFWIAWRLAVRITEPRSRLAADTAKAGAPGRRPGSSHEMQVCRTFGRNHLSRSVL